MLVLYFKFTELVLQILFVKLRQTKIESQRSAFLKENVCVYTVSSCFAGRASKWLHRNGVSSYLLGYFSNAWNILCL